MEIKTEKHSVRNQRWRLFLPFLTLTVLKFSTCGLGAGNVVGVMNVPSNVKSEIIKQYGDVLEGRYDVPDSLSQHIVQYDHLGTHGYYFGDSPRAVYTVSLSSGYRVISIYYPDTGRRIINGDELSDEDKSEVEQRVLSQVIKPIWEYAVYKQLPDSLVYIFSDCQSHVICNP